MSEMDRPGWLQQLRQRGVLRVAASYAVIGWLLLQIADVTFEPLGLPKWTMPALIVTAAIGFPVAVLLAWFFELGDHGITRDGAPSTGQRPHVHGVRRYADIAIIGVLLATVAVLLVKQSDLGKPPLPDKPSLAVLPFTNLSGDPEQQYFSDGLAEELLDRLGQVPGLMVVARSSSFSIRGQDIDARSVAEKLGVTAVLEGAVRRDGKRLRLSAKLIDGKSGYQLWSGTFDREVNDVFAVQSELAQAVINAIVPVARGDTVVLLHAPPTTTNLSAYDLYLLGRAKANTRFPTNVEKAAEYFEQALEIDPDFARAQAQLALTRVLLIDLYEDGDAARAVRTERAEAAAFKALAMDPKSAEALVAYASLLRTMRRPGVEEAYERAIEANPNSADAWHGYSFFLSTIEGHEKESRAAVRRAHALDPLAISPWMNYLGGILRPGAVEFRMELQRANAVLDGNPDSLRRFAIVASTSGYPLEAWQILTTVRRDAAASGIPRSITAVGPLGIWMFVDPGYTLQHGEQLLDDPEISANRTWLLGTLITAAGRRGDEARLRELFERYAAIKGDGDPELNALRAFWYSVLGRFDEAASALVHARQMRDEDSGSPMVLGDSNDRQSVPATLRILRNTGRQSEANALAAQHLAKYRSVRPKNSDEENYGLWVRDAALAANEGLEQEAVDMLRQAMRWQDVPIGFAPELPWFRGLEGYPAYDAILREHKSRIERARTEMLALDASLQVQQGR